MKTVDLVLFDHYRDEKFQKFESFGFTCENVDDFTWLREWLRDEEKTKKHIERIKTTYWFLQKKETFTSVIREVLKDGKNTSTLMDKVNADTLYLFMMNCFGEDNEEINTFFENEDDEWRSNEFYYIISDVIEYYTEKAGIDWWCEE